MNQALPDSAQTRRLLEDAREGRAAAFGELLARHRQFLRDEAGRRMDPRLQPRLDPSDVVQETQLEAFGLIADYLERKPMPFRLWLLKTLHQRLAKAERFHLKAARRSVMKEAPQADRSSLALARQLLASTKSAGQRVREAELAQHVRQELARLSPADREIVLLRNFDGLSNQQAACLLDISTEAAKKRYARAILRLQAALRGKEPVESRR
jgi:RNA polymerase sigma-70 factor (ECF subfamily)